MPLPHSQRSPRETSKVVVRGMPALPVKTRGFILVIWLTFIVALLLTIFVRLPDVRQLRGRLVSSGDVATILAPQQGFVEKIFVAEGMPVKRGDPLVRISSGIAHERLGDSRAAEGQELQVNLDATRRLKTRVAQDAARARQDADNQKGLLERQLAELQQSAALKSDEVALLEQGLSRAQKLRAGGTTALPFLEQSKLAVLSARQQLASLRMQIIESERNLAQIMSNGETAQADYERRLDEVNTQIDQFQLRLDDLRRGEEVTVFSSIDGTVAKLIVQEGSSVGYTNLPLLVVAGQTDRPVPFRFEFFSSSLSLDGLRVGQSARVELDSFDVNDWGALTVTITSISPVPYTSSELGIATTEASEAFVITAEYAQEDELIRRIAPELRANMSATGFFVTARRRLITWIIAPVERVIELLFYVDHREDTKT